MEESPDDAPRKSSRTRKRVVYDEEEPSEIPMPAKRRKSNPPSAKPEDLEKIYLNPDAASLVVKSSALETIYEMPKRSADPNKAIMSATKFKRYIQHGSNFSNPSKKQIKDRGVKAGKMKRRGVKIPNAHMVSDSALEAALDLVTDLEPSVLEAELPNLEVNTSVLHLLPKKLVPLPVDESAPFTSNGLIVADTSYVEPSTSSSLRRKSVEEADLPFFDDPVIVKKPRKRVRRSGTVEDFHKSILDYNVLNSSSGDLCNVEPSKCVEDNLRVTGGIDATEASSENTETPAPQIERNKDASTQLCVSSAPSQVANFIQNFETLDSIAENSKKFRGRDSENDCISSDGYPHTVKKVRRNSGICKTLYNRPNQMEDSNASVDQSTILSITQDSMFDSATPEKSPTAQLNTSERLTPLAKRLGDLQFDSGTTSLGEEGTTAAKTEGEFARDCSSESPAALMSQLSIVPVRRSRRTVMRACVANYVEESIVSYADGVITPIDKVIHPAVESNVSERIDHYNISNPENKVCVEEECENLPQQTNQHLHTPVLPIDECKLKNLVSRRKAPKETFSICKRNKSQKLPSNFILPVTQASKKPDSAVKLMQAAPKASLTVQPRLAEVTSTRPVSAIEHLVKQSKKVSIKKRRLMPLKVSTTTFLADTKSDDVDQVYMPSLPIENVDPSGRKSPHDEASLILAKGIADRKLNVNLLTRTITSEAKPNENKATITSDGEPSQKLPTKASDLSKSPAYPLLQLDANSPVISGCFQNEAMIRDGKSFRNKLIPSNRKSISLENIRFYKKEQS